jgi:rhamnosyl/mannosyltransferase
MEEARLWIIGDGHQAQTSQQLSQQLGLQGARFWGQLPDEAMIALLRQAHALVLPSVTRSEAFGLALLEGMSAGCVPVASHLPGVADVVGNEGFTFPAGDAQALHQILTRLRHDAALRLHHAGLAQARARLYPWQRVIFGYERIFDRLVAGEKRNAELATLDPQARNRMRTGQTASNLMKRIETTLSQWAR